MSIKLMSLVWGDHTGELTGAEKAVLLRMADFAADNGTQIFPSITTIAADTGFSDSSVKRAIAQLVVKKRIKKTVRHKKLQYISNLYSINVVELQKAVDKPVDKSKNKKAGWVQPEPRGGVTVNPGGVTVSYDPPTDPPHRSVTKNKAVSSDEEVGTKVAAKLRKLGVTRNLLRLINEVTYHVQHRDTAKLTEAHAINAACSLIAADKWSTPYNLASQESKRLENDFTAFKQAEAADAKRLFGNLGDAMRYK